MKLSNELQTATDGLETSDEVIQVIANLFSDGYTWNHTCQYVWENGYTEENTKTYLTDRIFDEAIKLADSDVETIYWGTESRKNPKYAEQAFENAIEQGRLSNDPNKKNYSGKYMYMGKDNNGKNMFKNIDTRSYID